MNPTIGLKPVLAIIAAASLLAACETSSTSPGPKPAPAKAKPAPQNEDRTRPPRLGMSKEQVRARYGRPVNVSSSSRGESWSYVIDGFDGTAFIPFYGPVHNAVRKRHGGVIFFDANGRVKDFTWNEADPGAAMFR